MANPIRVLHIVGQMGRGGGVETWLMHLLRRINTADVAFDFLVDTDQPGEFDSEIRDLGGRIIPCVGTRQLWRYGQRLVQSLTRFGPFQVVHSHADLFSGFTLAVAARLNVPRRLAHSHNDRRMIGRPPGIFKGSYRSILRASLRRHMTHGFAVSTAAAQDLFGANYLSDKRVRILPCAIDYTPFLSITCGLDVRAELAIPHGAKVIGHVGRFEPQKNHQFLIDAFTIAARRDEHLHLLLVGEGSLRQVVEQRVRELGLGDRVTFAGLRSDVHRMLAAMDAFAFPSWHEGLGLALVEAQAARLPIVVSDSIPGDALIAGHWIKRVGLTDENEWAAAMSEAVQLPSEMRTRSVDERFDIDRNLQEWLAVYRSPC